MYAEKADRRKGGAAGIHPAWRVIGMPACPFCWFVRFLCFFGLFSTNPPKQNTHTHTHTHTHTRSFTHTHTHTHTQVHLTATGAEARIVSVKAFGLGGKGGAEPPQKQKGWACEIVERLANEEEGLL